MLLIQIKFALLLDRRFSTWGTREVRGGAQNVEITDTIWFGVRKYQQVEKPCIRSLRLALKTYIN
jgi:hypothetical protein